VFATTTLTKTLIVNPAFLQEIKDSNPDLWQTVHHLRQVCQCHDEPAVVARQLARLLDALRDQLALQFSLEESYGYLEVPEEQSGHSGELAAHTHSQHCTLYLRLSELAEQAEELQYRGVEPALLRDLVESTCDFDSQLRDHEQRENELIERTFNIG
jgi:hypothetical protein